MVLGVIVKMLLRVIVKLVLGVVTIVVLKSENNNNDKQLQQIHNQ